MFLQRFQRFAGWRAIWVHPPAASGAAFDMLSADASMPVTAEAEVDRVAEAQMQTLSGKLKKKRKKRIKEKE